MSQDSKTTANDRDPAGCEAGGVSSRPVSQHAKEPNNGVKPIKFRIPSAGARADGNERKRSSLLGVQLCHDANTEAIAAHNVTRKRLADAIVAARDAGNSVQAIADSAKISRQAVYDYMHRHGKTAR